MKKFLAAFATIFIAALTLTGCQTQQAPTGSITMAISAFTSGVSQSFSLPANTEYYRENGQSEQTIELYVQDLESTVRTRLWNNMFLQLYAIYLANPIEEFALGGDIVSLKQVAYNSVSDSVSFSFVYGSYDAWRYYHPSSDEEGSDQTNDSLFLEVDESEGSFPFSQLSGSEPAGYIYAQVIEEVKLRHFPTELVEAEAEMTFAYDYATTHKRVHSNADYTFSDSLYHHVWQQSYSELANAKTIHLYTVSANRGWWYLIALGAALVVAAIGVPFLAKRNKKVEKNKESFV